MNVSAQLITVSTQPSPMQVPGRWLLKVEKDGGAGEGVTMRHSGPEVSSSLRAGVLRPGSLLSPQSVPGLRSEI